VHPWHDETVSVLRRYGNHALDVERENGMRRIIPISWTSVVPRVVCRAGDGQVARLDPNSALKLATWLAARRVERNG
jgi:hypothetical protein